MNDRQLERIADSLERIANALERSHLTPRQIEDAAFERAVAILRQTTVTVKPTVTHTVTVRDGTPG